MPAIEAEDALMAELFADLDASCFSPPSSSQPLAASQGSRARPAHPAKRVKPATPSPRPQTRADRLPRPTPSSRSAPSFQATQPAPFWDNPFAHPPLTQQSLAERDRRERAIGVAPSLPRDAGRKVVGRVRVNQDPLADQGPNAGVKRGREDRDVGKGRAVKHVAVEIEGKENADVLRRRQARERKPIAVKKEEEGEPMLHAPIRENPVVDEFADMLEEVDWEKEMLAFDDEAKAVHKDEKYVPRSKRYVRCQVEEVVESVGALSRPQKLLTVSSKAFDDLRQVALCDDWVDTPVVAGDIVNLVGDFDLAVKDTPLQLTRSHGLLILHPDILVSSTKVADSSHCTRKAVLQEIIRTVGGSTPSLLYGNMLHSLMQSCMTEGRWDDEYRHAKIEEVVKEYGGQLWTIDVGFEKAKEELLNRSKEFEAFAVRFVGEKPKVDAFLSDPRAVDTARSRLAIISTLDVEDDIWSPRFGLKGKIDVSTRANVVDSVGFSRKGTAPFEIKTGRTNAGMEHRAQTMLYTLLMSDRFDEDIDSGLLYYTQSNEVFRVQAARNEIRGLILARNRFATFLHRRMTLTPSGFVPPTQVSQASQPPPGSPRNVKDEPSTGNAEDEDDALWGDVDVPVSSQVEGAELALLPPPIDDERSCKKCYVGDACMLYRKAVDGDEAICDDETDPLQLIYAGKTDHITPAHANFFKHWERLISLEEQELVRFKKEIWTLQAEEREQLGRCFANMVISEVKAEDLSSKTSVHRFVYRLRPRSPPDSSLLGGSISTNDPVVVSLETPSILAISRGFVLSLSPVDLVIGVDRSLTACPQTKGAAANELVFRVDKDELAAGMGRIRDNLVQLFTPGADARRRSLVVDLAAPRFRPVEEIKQAGLPSHLNDDQRQAVAKVLTAQDYALILGMPGTGKTTTTAEIIKALAQAGKSILLTSYTHSAVDNILLKVKDAGLSILRLGNRDKVLPSLHPYTLSSEDYAHSLSDIDNKLLRPQIVATTCLGINEPIFVKRRFDVCIVDEASQVTLPTCLGPLRFADSFVLVGDHNQLPPLVRNGAARKGGLDVSLFKRLSDAHPNAVVNLTHQYRMNSDIMSLSNELVYSGQLKVGDERVGGRKLGVRKDLAESVVESWVWDIIDPDRSVIFVDTDALPARERRNGSLIDNLSEAVLVTKTVSALAGSGVDEEEIGVISLYRQQIKLLSRQLSSHPGVEILTADRSQGRDKECIVLSLVRSNTSGNAGDLLKDWRRINVCLTRAKSKLVIFGSRSTISHVQLMADFVRLVEAKGWVYELPAGAADVAEDVKVKLEEDVEENKPVIRRGKGALALRSPLASDILNSL
ncbi:putative DNA replication helicase Dna2 [Rhodotorula toruloides ATCC 204091]|nr:putative DNA replication helicase Dna2 [Rhodotorula toruloides ATCC 204091]KAK4329847.1 DNA replication ATP-dependent helicase/nuclease DNA2 [Rhodotorula toruloides]